MSVLTSLLVRDQRVSVRKIEEAIQRQVIAGGTLDTTLLELRLVPENVLAGYCGAAAGLALVDRDLVMATPPETLKLVPRDVAIGHRFVPLGIDDEGRLSVAVSAPLATETLGQLAFLHGGAVVQRLVCDARLESALSTFYDEEPTPRMKRLIRRLDQREPGRIPVVAPLAPNVMARGEGSSERYSREAVAEETPTESVAERPTGWSDDDANVRGRARKVTSGGWSGSEQTKPAIVAPPPDVGTPLDPEPEEAAEPAVAPHPGGETESAARPVEMPAPAVARLSVPRSDLLTRRRGPLTLEKATELLRKGHDRDELLEIAFAYARQFFDTTALFLLHEGRAECLDAVGPEVPPFAEVKQLALDLQATASFRALHQRAAPVRFLFGEDAGDEVLKVGLGRTGGQVGLLVPIAIRQRVILALYGDHGAEELNLGDVPEILAFAPQLGVALQELILRRKTRRFEERSRGDDVSATGAPPENWREGPARPKPLAGASARVLAERSMADVVDDLVEEELRSEPPREPPTVDATVDETEHPTAEGTELPPADETGHPTADEALEPGRRTLVGPDPVGPDPVGPDPVGPDMVPDYPEAPPTSADDADAEVAPASHLDPADTEAADTDAEGAASEAEALDAELARSTLPDLPPVDLDRRRTSTGALPSSLPPPPLGFSGAADPSAEPNRRPPRAHSPTFDLLGVPRTAPPPPKPGSQPEVQTPSDSPPPPDHDPVGAPDWDLLRRESGLGTLAAALDTPAPTPTPVPEDGEDEEPPLPGVVNDDPVDRRSYVGDGLPRRPPPKTEPVPPGSGAYALKPRDEEVIRPGESSRRASSAPPPVRMVDLDHAGDDVESTPDEETHLDPRREGASDRLAAADVVRVPDTIEAPRQRASDEEARPSPVPASLGAEGAPSVILELDKEIAELVDQLYGVPPDESVMIDRVVRHGEVALPALVRAFPGNLWFDRHRPHRRLPRGRDVSAVARTVVAFGSVAGAYLTTLLGHDDADTRFYALLCAAEIRDYPRLVGAIRERLFDDDKQVAALALDVLREMRLPERELDDLLQNLRSTARVPTMEPRRRIRAVRALGALRDRRAVDLLIDLLDGPVPKLTTTARRALQAITARDLGTSTRKWRGWYEEHGEEHRVEWLIEGLCDGSEDVRKSAYADLKDLSQQYLGYSPNAPRKEREVAQRKYRAWWDTEGRASFSD